MAPVSSGKSLPHLVKPGGDRLAEFFVNQLEYAIDAVNNIYFADFIYLFQRALLEFDDELLVHRENGNLEIRMRKFCYGSHVCVN